MSLGNERSEPRFATELSRGVGLVAMTGASVGGVLSVAAIGLRALGL